MLRKILFSLLVCCVLCPVVTMAQHYTVLVSLDGFRDDYTKAYHTPFIDYLADTGVSATMQPSFPSKTFPNHYTIVTGLYPDHHGIIANRFYDQQTKRMFSLGNKATKQDPYFWGGEPIWNTAARQGIRTGVVYWPGSDVKIGGRYPDYYHDYEQKPLLTYAERIAEVVKYLRMPENKRPRLVLAYFDEPDHTGHGHGPFAPETRRCVEHMDGIMEEFYNALQTLPHRDSVNLILLSDHGMATIDAQHLVNPFDYIDEDWVEHINYDIPTHIWPKKGCERKILVGLQRMPHVTLWKQNEVPAYLHYGTNKNIAPILINPQTGWTIGKKAMRIKGTHGFDPTCVDMQVIFRAIGPDFKSSYHKEQVFSNINIYALLCKLLGITPAKNDGSLQPVCDMLRVGE